MSITEDELVDSYGTGNAKERFDLIYENYSVFPQLVDCFEIGLFNTILNEKEYNKRAKNSADLGVRVQTSNKSDPTAKMAVERVMIREAIERCDTDGGILKDTDNPEKHKKDIWTIAMMRREYEVFDSFLNALKGDEYQINYKYIHKDLSVAKIGEERNRTEKTIRNKLCETRKKLEKRIIPFFREAI